MAVRMETEWSTWGVGAHSQALQYNTHIKSRMVPAGSCTRPSCQSRHSTPPAMPPAPPVRGILPPPLARLRGSRCEKGGGLATDCTEHPCFTGAQDRSRWVISSSKGYSAGRFPQKKTKTQTQTLTQAPTLTQTADRQTDRQSDS